jgi:hypothetical protein
LPANFSLTEKRALQPGQTTEMGIEAAQDFDRCAWTLLAGFLVSHSGGASQQGRCVSTWQ